MAAFHLVGFWGAFSPSYELGYKSVVACVHAFLHIRSNHFGGDNGFAVLLGRDSSPLGTPIRGFYVLVVPGPVPSFFSGWARRA